MAFTIGLVMTSLLLRAEPPSEVWVSAARGDDIEGDGTYEHPYYTIQTGVVAVATGGTVKILRGTYDYGEHFDGAHTNRVIINKRITLDGVEGKEVTHIVGKLSSATSQGNGPDAIRCIKLSSADANYTIIKNLTLRNGGAANVSQDVASYGGAVNAWGAARYSPCLVDCVVSNSTAIQGGGICGVMAVRCIVSNCKATGYGSGVCYGQIMHCLIKGCQNYGTSGNRPAAGYTWAVNCTLIESPGKTSGFGRACRVYNCFARGCGAADIETTGGNTVAVADYKNCYTSSGDNPFYDSAAGDYRLNLSTTAVDGGLTSHFSQFSPPAGIAANVDLSGRAFDLSAEKCDIGCYQVQVPIYADAEGGDDDNDGSSPSSAKKTLAAAMSAAQRYDTVHAAEGTYDEGVMRGASSAGWNAKSRVVVRSNVTLVADGRKENTFIVGAPDRTASGDEYGLGTNAVRCVYLQSGSCVKGFTLTGGYTWSTIPEGNTESQQTLSGNWSGGGVCGYSSGRDDAFARNCIISNNWGYYAGGIRYANAVNCRIFENHALENGGALREANAYGCLIDKNYSGFNAQDKRASCSRYTRLVGCTIGPLNYTLDNGTAFAISAASSSSAVFVGNLVLGTTGTAGSGEVSHSVFSGPAGGWSLDATSVRNASGGIEVDGNMRPILGRNVGIDKCSLDALRTASRGQLPLDVDMSGFRRVMNGAPDVGALECDWSDVYAKCIDRTGRHVALTAVSDNAVTNYVGGVPSVRLQDGESLSMSWTDEKTVARRGGRVSVVGEGTLTVMLGGEPFAEFTADSPSFELSIPGTEPGTFNLSFAFEGSGSADICGFKSTAGMVIMVL